MFIDLLENTGLLRWPDDTIAQFGKNKLPVLQRVEEEVGRAVDDPYSEAHEWPSLKPTIPELLSLLPVR
jgi:hypothetical protein